MTKRKCLACKRPIPWTMRINGIRRNLKVRRYCIWCVPYGSRNNGAQFRRRQDGLKQCKGKCQQLLPATAFQKRDGVCKDCINRQRKIDRTAMKRRCVDYLGGKCNKCGYSKCLRALEFHHRDPQAKDIEISTRRYLRFESLKPELDKCTLLCRNCHAEAHDLLSSTTGPE